MKNALKLFVCITFFLFITEAIWAKEKSSIVVLPFSIHSAENIDYVRQGIWDMLSSRIAVQDKIEVTNRESVLEAMKEMEGKELTLSYVYSLGKKMNTDFIVWGSITKIGNNLSIDGKLIDIAANKSPVSIFAQTQGLDEVIPKINDFAQRIDQHILGSIPTTFTNAPLPVQPTTKFREKQSTQSAQEAKIIEGMKTSKRGTFTSAIDPSFINASQSGQPINKRKFWMSQEYPTKFQGLDIGDVNQDGLNEIVLIDQNNIMIYQKKENTFKTIQIISGKSYNTYLSLDVADINQNSIPEIIVTSTNGNQLNSFILEYAKGKFNQIASDLRWFLRVINSSSGLLLLGQYQGEDKIFDTPIYEIIWEDGKYKQGKIMQIPQGLSVYGLTIENIGTGGTEKVIALDEYDHLSVYDQTTKHITRIDTFLGGKECLWKSDDFFGGSNNYLNVTPPVGRTASEEQSAYINLRILSSDINKDGKKEVIIVKNSSPLAGTLKSVKFLTSSEIYDLEWDGMGMAENWRTGKINGYVADYQLKDIDNDGENEIVLAVVASTELSIKGRSFLASYKLNVQ